MLGGLSEPRDIGRSRTVTAAQRRAVISRNKHCALPGCRQPARRCDVHHIISWMDGGPTDINNLALLCKWHDIVIHHSEWTRHIDNGIPIFDPPTCWHTPPTRSHRPRKPFIRCRYGGATRTPSRT
ncbi:MAG: HNH endonuclease signature motif containing protein [Mycobacteriales bacterium]